MAHFEAEISEFAELLSTSVEVQVAVLFQGVRRTKAFEIAEKKLKNWLKDLAEGIQNQNLQSIISELKMACPLPVSEEEKCQGVTRNGSPCRNKALKDSKFCYSHNEIQEKKSVQCSAFVGKQKDKQCKNKAAPESEFCKRHEKRDEVERVQCLAMVGKSKGRQCKNMAILDQQYCKRHEHYGDQQADVQQVEVQEVKEKVQCSALTKNKQQCKNSVIADTKYCKRHTVTHEEDGAVKEKKSEKIQCSAMIPKGKDMKQCKLFATKDSEFCKKHADKANQYFEIQEMEGDDFNGTFIKESDGKFPDETFLMRVNWVELILSEKYDDPVEDHCFVFEKKQADIRVWGERKNNKRVWYLGKAHNTDFPIRYFSAAFKKLRSFLGLQPLLDYSLCIQDGRAVSEEQLNKESGENEEAEVQKEEKEQKEQKEQEAVHDEKPESVDLVGMFVDMEDAMKAIEEEKLEDLDKELGEELDKELGELDTELGDLVK